MNPIFENECTATNNYDFFVPYNRGPARSLEDEPKITLHEGRKYEAVGESYGGDISFGKRFLHIAAITCMVALGILLVLIPFFFEGYRALIVDQLKKQSGVNVHHIPLQPRMWQEFAINKVLEPIRLKFKYLPHDIEYKNTLDSAACCIKITFEGGELKKQFIFESKFTLNSHELLDGIPAIRHALEKALNEEIDLETKYLNFDYTILFREKDGKITTFSSSMKRSSAVGEIYSPEKEETFTEVEKVDSSVLQEIGFSGECLDYKGSFIEGAYFHVPPKPRFWQELAIGDVHSGVVGSIYHRFKHLPSQVKGYDSLDSAACCLKIAYDGGEVRKQFIAKGRVCANSDSLFLSGYGIERALKRSLEEEIDLKSKYLNIGYAILFKEKEGMITACTGEIYKSQNSFKSEPEKEMSTAVVEELESTILEKIGFDGECVDSEGNFIEGKYFQES